MGRPKGYSKKYHASCLEVNMFWCNVLICLGVMKTLIMFWIGKKGNNRLKLNDYDIKSISKIMKMFRKYISEEFCRLSKAIENVDHWKARI